MGHFVDHLSRDFQPKVCDVTVLNFVHRGLSVTIDLFRGACAVNGNVQVAGHVKPAPFSRRDVTLGDVDGSLFHIKI